MTRALRASPAALRNSSLMSVVLPLFSLWTFRQFPPFPRRDHRVPFLHTGYREYDISHNYTIVLYLTINLYFTYLH